MCLAIFARNGVETPRGNWQAKLELWVEGLAVIVNLLEVGAFCWVSKITPSDSMPLDKGTGLPLSNPSPVPT